MSSFVKKAVVFFKGPKKKKNNKSGDKNLGIASEKACLPKIVQTEEPKKDKMEEVEKEGEEALEIKIKNKGKLFVGGLKLTTTSKGLEDYFARFGKVVDAFVMRFPDSSKSRGFGFVTFAEQEDADLVLGMNHVLDGKEIDLRAFDSNERENRKKAKGGKDEGRIFLGGIPFTVTEEDLRSFFVRYGRVTNVIIPSDRETKKRKGYAFLSFEEKKAAEKCLAEEFVYFKGRRVHVMKADKRSDSRAKSSSDWDGDGDTDTESLIEDETRSSASSDERQPAFVKVAEFKEFFEQYLLTKSTLENTMNGKKLEPLDKKLVALEQMMLGLKTTGKEVNVMNLIDFSDEDDDSDECDAEEEEDDDDNDDDDYDVESDRDCNNEEERNPSLNTAVRKFRTAVNEFQTMNSIDGVNPNNDSHINKGCTKDTELISLNSPAPFTTKGSLLCSLCQWGPEDGSCESFLAHCKTPTHRIKIRDRFLESKSDAKLPDAGDGDKEIAPGLVFPYNSGDSKKKEDLNKVPPLKMEGAVRNQKQKVQQIKKNTEKQKEQEVVKQVQKIKNTEKQKEQEVVKQVQKIKNHENSNEQQEKKPKKEKVKNEQKQQKPEKAHQKTKNPSQKQTEKDEYKQPKVSQEAVNLKMQAFAKGMVSIQPLSENKLHCTMCNKIIPKAQDFNTLMKNVSHHLHSKKHLNNLLITENSLKSELEKKPESENEKSGGKSSNCVQGNVPKKKEPAKIANNKIKSSTPEESKTVTRKPSQGSEESLVKGGTGSKRKNIAKAEAPAPSNVKKTKEVKK